MAGPVPPLDPRPLRGMEDMGMADMGDMTMSTPPGAPKPGVAVDNIAMMPQERLGEAGDRPRKYRTPGTALHRPARAQAGR